MTTFRLAAVGDNCIDRFEEPVGEAYVGGNAINVAVQWALLGQQSFYFGAVGRDRNGAQVRQLLKQNGVRLDGRRNAGAVPCVAAAGACA